MSQSRHLSRYGTRFRSGAVAGVGTAAVLAGLVAAGPEVPASAAGSFVVSQAQFDTMFPSRNSFYSYNGLTQALGAYPGFANSGDATTRKREAAAFLANVSHETAGLKYVVEQNKANHGHYCDRSQPYGCPAGDKAYYGRGPLQLSWNFNYKAAGDALHLDLLHDPYKVERDSAAAWKTGLWFWNSQSGAGSMTPHDAMVHNKGFGETIRSINGDLECNGKNPDERQDRINLYQKFTRELGVSAGGNLSC
ncbi:chitinase [Streptomyces subrutilus]|uniref:chitinase n=1 Tax=Streptomyces subrutilus TaxID=36818 RepID=UPI002E11D7F3|nr:chitinase [Streptomyces subrutilus]